MKKEIFLDFLTAEQALDSPVELAKYGRDWLKDYRANASLALFPRSYDQLTKILARCQEHKIAVVPSGGRTGLSGGATALNGEIILSLERLNKILTVNRSDFTLTCQAGATTQAVQEAAAQAGMYFPVDFASKGSSQIGGNIALNAGGIRVGRYGTMREWVIGLKIVTASGELLELNGGLHKNQTGYDLRNLIIGSEGTLAVIAEATLKLTTIPRGIIRILCGVPDISAIIPLYSAAKFEFPSLSVFEYFSRAALEEVVTKHNLKDPLSSPHPEYLLIELEDTGHTAQELEKFFGEKIEAGIISDAVVSSSAKQAAELLNLRELIPETLNANYTLHKNDISVPISSVPDLLTRLEGCAADIYPDCKIIIFGHIGDGNLHINALKPGSMQEEEFFGLCKSADEKVYSVVRELHGSISAEHGIGLLKKDFLSFSRTEREIELMRAIKRVFDPAGILNPGKIFNL